MKKIILAIFVFSIIFPYFSHAAFFGFMDNKFYDIKGELKVFGFMDGTYFDLQGQQVWLVDGEFINIKPDSIVIASSTPTPPPITVTPLPQNSLVIVNPTQNSVQTIITNPMSSFNPFDGSPYLIGEFDQWNPERTVNNRYAVIGINLTREEKDPRDIYRLICTNMNTGEVFSSDNARTGATDGKVDYKKRVGDISEPGTYSCYFKFTLPEGIFTSEVFSYTLE